MKAEELRRIFDRLDGACAKPSTTVQRELIEESIIDNEMTDEEILRAYRVSRDAKNPWFPRPGEWLERGRPPVQASEVSGEAETVFGLILDCHDGRGPNLKRFGREAPGHPYCFDRRMIEEALGPVAGVAFAAVQSRFRGGLQKDDDERFARVEFCKAYVDARKTLPPPVLTPPSRQLEAKKDGGQITGSTKEEPGEFQKKFRDMVGGFRSFPSRPVDYDSRKRELQRQADELLGR